MGNEREDEAERMKVTSDCSVLRERKEGGVKVEEMKRMKEGEEF